jgi:putative ABC transport system permease protein
MLPMTDFFGVSMTAIVRPRGASGRRAAVVVAVASATASCFDRLRNIRRRAQSVLIVPGLMLSTIIVAAAFAIGDTVRYSVTNETYARLGHVDEFVQVQENRKNLEFTDEQIAPAGLIPRQITDLLLADLNGNDDIDGMLPGVRLPVPVSNTRLKLTEPQVVLVGLDERITSGFEDDIATPDGRPIDLSQLRRFDTLVNESTAKAPQHLAGDRDRCVGGRNLSFSPSSASS